MPVFRPLCIAAILALSACQATAPGQPAPEATLGTTGVPLAEVISPAPYQPPQITASELRTRREAKEDMLVVDVRQAAAYAKEHAEGAVNLPWADLPQGQASLPKDRLLLIYCTCPDERSSAGAAVDLHDKYGFSKLLVLKGGLQAWKDVGLPTTAGG